MPHIRFFDAFDMPLRYCFAAFFDAARFMIFERRRCHFRCVAATFTYAFAIAAVDAIDAD